MSLGSFIVLLSLCKAYIARLVTATGIDGSAITSGQVPIAHLQEATDYADTLVIGLLDDRGNYDASVNTFPATGGSGAAGAIKKGDIWTISVVGTLGGVLVAVGDTVRALVDTPAQTAGNWAIGATGNLGVIIHSAADKAVPVAADEFAIWNSVTGLLARVSLTNLIAAFQSMGVNVQTGTTYTLQDSDNGKIIRFTNGAAITLIINSAQAFAGMNFIVEQAGAGQITFAGTATLDNYSAHTKTAGQKAAVSFFCSVASTFNFGGQTA